MKYYLDTCIWISYFDESEEQHEAAVKLFEKIKQTAGDVIIISGRHTLEMANKNMLDKFNQLKNELYSRRKCRGINTTELDRQIAYKHNEKEKLGYSDCLHLQLAKKANALPVSFDQDWFDLGKKMQVRVYSPEEIII